ETAAVGRRSPFPLAAARAREHVNLAREAVEALLHPHHGVAPHAALGGVGTIAGLSNLDIGAGRDVDNGVQPLPDRHAGSASSILRGLARAWPDPGDPPRTAKIHAVPRFRGLTGRSRADWPGGTACY